MTNMLIGSKLIFVLALAMALVEEPSAARPLSVLLLLLYISVNAAMSLVKRVPLINLLLTMNLVLILFGSWKGNPLFILFLSLAVSELAKKNRIHLSIVLIVSFIPIYYIEASLRIPFVIAALFSILVHEFIDREGRRRQRQNELADRLRLERRRLLDRLNENNEFLKQSAYASKLEERNRISQQIHDDVGHSITGSLIQMEAARTLLAANPEKADELIGNAIGIAREGIESIRLTLKDMKPPSEQVGYSRLKLYMDEFTDRHGIRTVLVADGNIDAIRPIHWKIIMENCGEAFTNSLKYADGAPIRVELAVLNKLIKLTVKDSGSGAKTVRKGIGLTGMEERAASIAGKLIIDGTSGFSVTTLLPLE